MASLDSLPADQRAVLQLVLQRGRTYDEIAAMLSIDRAAVRERALAALDTLGPDTKTPAPQRALLTDYLLGQLPARVAEQTHDRLWNNPSERAWARVVAGEISQLSPDRPLPDIPVGRPPAGDAGGDAPISAPPRPAERRREPEPVAATVGRRRAEEYEQYEDEATREPARIPPDYGLDEPGRQPAPKRSSRRGGAILLGTVALAVVIALIAILSSGGGGSKRPKTTASTSTASTPSSTSTSTTGTGTSPQAIAQVNLTSPNGASKAAGVAQVIKQGSATGIVIVARGLPANNGHDAYAVWLFKSSSQTHFLGFVQTPVKADGKLQVASPLPTGASQYNQLLVTRETQPKPTAPGPVVLQGRLSLSG